MCRFAIGAGVALVGACTLATSALASSGGAAAPTPTPVGVPVSGTPSATAGTIQFVPANVNQGHITYAQGVLSTSDAGQTVALELHAASGTWLDVANRTIASNGSFDIPWRATTIGRFTMRVVTGASAASTSTSVTTPTATLQVFQAVIATWYGPGFYGHRTACGQTLTTHILGVANRTLPCGTPVVLTWHGHTVTVPVIDRGPYANGATFDLTAATAQALTIQETVTLGWLKLAGKLNPGNWYAPGTAPNGSTGSTGASGATGISGNSGTTGSSALGGAQAPG
jgi:rare lipoprotein A (peptidoglycan hydrolase)